MNREAVCVAFTFIDLQKKNASVCLIVSVCKSEFFCLFCGNTVMKTQRYSGSLY